MWNFPTYNDFPGLSGLGFLNAHVWSPSFAKVLLRDFSSFFFGFQFQKPSTHLAVSMTTFSFLSQHVQTHCSTTDSHSHYSSPRFSQMMSPEHLSCVWLQQLLFVLLKLCLTLAGPLRPLNGTECTARGPASYILVFTGHWSPQAFPKQYPLFRPPAQWSKLMGESHAKKVLFGKSAISGGNCMPLWPDMPLWLLRQRSVIS